LTTDKEVEEWIERYPSVRNWLVRPEGEKPLSIGTKRSYIGYMKKYCSFTGMNPDEIAKSEEMGKIRDLVAWSFEQKGLPISSSVRYRIHPLNSFWTHNGRIVTDPYEGIRPHIRNALLRLRRVSKNGNVDLQWDLNGEDREAKNV
jgi:hypothetical protein